jgi:hypothetical protein
LQRLVSLIGALVNLSEFQEDDSNGVVEIQYPCVKHNTQCYAATIKTAIEKSAYYGPELYINVVNALNNSTLKVLLANDFFDKITPYRHEPMTMKKCAKLLKHSIAFSDEPKFVSASTSSTSLSGMFEKYLVLDKRRPRSEFGQVSKQQYLELYQIAFDAYLETYRIHDIYNILKRRCSLKSNIIPSSDDQQKIYKNINYNDLEDDLEAFLSAANDSLEENLVLDQQEPTSVRFSCITVDPEKTNFYKEEIKFYRVIYQEINNMDVNETEQVRHLKSYIEKL